MNATNKQGHVWTGEHELGWWMYCDDQGNEYEAREIPALRIVMDKAALTRDGIMPVAAI